VRRAVALALLLVACGCASKRQCLPNGTVVAVAPPPDWRDAVSDPDHVKLRGVRQAFLDGLAAARGAGFDAAIAAEGRLFDPDAAQDGAMPKPGRYRCRAFSLGTKTPGRPAFVAEEARGCEVTADGALARLREDEGRAQRLTGRLYPDVAARAIFLGTRMLADEATALHYGRDADRDTAGTITRVGPARWRLAIPRPAWQSTIEVVEIVPA
jgi:hypothetical protein